MPKTVDFQHEDAYLRIYFGGVRDALTVGALQLPGEKFLKHPAVGEVMSRLSLRSLLFLKQIHGAIGTLLSSEGACTTKPFELKGDFLVTSVPYVGIGVMTADCLPVICYDQNHHAIGIAHAGWRGAYQGVLQAMLACMNTAYGSCASDLICWFGPSACRCCYQVDEPFIKRFQSYPLYDQFWDLRADGLYFDLPLFAQQLLMIEGVLPERIIRSYHCCTICNFSFCSHRRAAHGVNVSDEGRQMTVVSLRAIQ